MAINNFGFSGVNGHILLRSNQKLKNDSGSSVDDVPRLVLISGRTVEAVNTIFDDVSK